MAARSGESKFMIVSLVIAILALIGVGIHDYYGWAGQATLENTAKDKDAQLKKAESERDFYRFVAWQMRDYANELSPAERKDYAAARAAYDTSAAAYAKDAKASPYAFLKPEEFGKYYASIALMDKVTGWSANEAQRKSGDRKTFPYLLTKLTRDLENAEQDKAKAENEKAQAIKERNDAQNLQKQTQANIQVDIDTQSKKDLARWQADIRGELEKKQQTIETQTQRADKAEMAVANLQVKLDDANKKIVDMKQEAALAAKIRIGKVDRLANDVPKGEIVGINRTGTSVTVQLVSTRNLPPQQTFAIHGVDSTGRALSEIKGSLVVTQVLDDHLVSARVTEMKDQGRDPVLKGDKVFTVGWNPMIRQHVALVGAFDLSGTSQGQQALRNPTESMRRLEEFRRFLERQGVIVDSYVDPREMKQEGKISLETDYLIVGESIEPRAPGLKEEKKDKEAAAKEPADKPKVDPETVTQWPSMAEAVDAMTKKAVAKGVTVVSMRTFLTLSGYQPPRAGGPDVSAVPLHPTVPAANSPLERLTPPTINDKR